MDFYSLIARLFFAFYGLFCILLFMKENFSPDLLIKARIRARMTLKMLSEASGVSEQQINRYEKGKVPPRPLTVGKLADALGLDLDDLYTEKS